MKFALIAVAVAASIGLATPAAAQLRISTSGLGDAVYVPYYTVEEGRDSLLTVSNSSDQPSMVRVLFAEAQNGQNVLNFNVYLPGRSVWSASLTAITNGGARLSSQSAVCTVPNGIRAGAQLVPFDYAANFPDGGATGIGRVRTGAIEVIELGALTGGLGNATTARNCPVIEAAYASINGVTPDRRGQILAPTGKISANLQLVKVVEGLILGIPGIAIQGFSSTPLDPDFNGYEPRFANPVLGANQAVFETHTANGVLRFAADRGPDAISSLFMQSELGGEFYANPNLGATTRWVISMPTKAAYVSTRPGSLARNGQPVSPFSSFFTANRACDRVTTRQGRLDGAPLQTLVLPTTVDLCQQVNLIDFNQPFADSGTTLLQFQASAIRTISALRPDGTPVVLNGLPAVGLQLSNFINGQLQGGVLANYSISQSLRSAPAGTGR